MSLFSREPSEEGNCVAGRCGALRGWRRQVEFEVEVGDVAGVGNGTFRRTVEAKTCRSVVLLYFRMRPFSFV